MNDQLCDAIRTHRLVRFIYEGYERIVEPHIHGINRASHEALSGYLIGGWSASEGAAGWRNYLVGEMHDLHVLAEQFSGAREGYNPDDANFRQVYCQL
jgi:hypothetical protein